MLRRVTELKNGFPLIAFLKFSALYVLPKKFLTKHLIFILYQLVYKDCCCCSFVEEE